MRTTAGTTTLPTNSQASHPQGRGSDQRGVITLEWLLIVGAIAGLAATSVLAVQQVLDDTSEVPVDPLVRVLEADIAAAFVAAEAQAAFDESLSDPLLPSYEDRGFSTRCHPGISQSFSDVVDPAGTPMPWTTPADSDGTPRTGDEVAARCTVKPLAGLGG